MDCLIVKNTIEGDLNSVEEYTNNSDISAIDIDKLYMDSFDDSELCPSFGYTPKLVMPCINTEASDFMSDNISEILTSIAKMGVDKSKIHDLYTDVYLSIRDAEMNGRGFNEDYDLSVRNFVFGRLKKYSLNKKYDPKYIENKNNGEYTLIAASCSGDDEEEINGFQAAYKNAAEIDNIDGIDDALSLKDAIETCIDYLHGTNINVISLFRSVENIVSLISTKAKRNHNANSVFYEIRSVGIKYPELFEAMELALRLRESNRDLFLNVLNSIEHNEMIITA